MGNALQKASPNVANKHTVLNNSQMSETGNGERSLLNVTDDNGGTTMLINDPRSPTEGINRTPIQVNVCSRSRSLFRGMFSGKKPTEVTEHTASANAAANTEDEKVPVTNGNGKVANEAVSVTASTTSPKVTTSTPLSEGATNGNTVHQTNGDAVKNGDAEVALPNGDNKQPPVDVEVKPTNGTTAAGPTEEVVEEDNNDTQNGTDHDVTTENEEAFIVVDNKKKKKKLAKAEAKAKADAEANGNEEVDQEPQQQQHPDQLEAVKNANKQPLTKGHSDSKLAYSKCEDDCKTSNGEPESAGTKPRLSNANENDSPSSFRVKVEKACRSLTNLSSKSKTVAVGNGKAMNGHTTRESGDEASKDNKDNTKEPCTTGASAPSSTSSPLVDIVQDSVTNDCNGNSNGKYMVLVNDE